MPKIRRWLPDTLAWWVFTVMAGVVILLSGSFIVFLLFNSDDRAILAAASQATDQVITVKRWVERDRPDDRAALINRFNSPMMRMMITKEPIVTRSDDSGVSQFVAAKLRREFRPGTEIRVDSLIEKPKQADTGDEEVADRQIETIEIPPVPDIAQANPPPRIPTAEEREARRLRQMQLGGPALLDSRGMFRVSVKFAENTWFNARVILTVGDGGMPTVRLLLLITFIAFVVAIGALWGVDRAFRPLALFAGAAERLGVDVNAAPLAEDGPGEVRRAAHAFNTMQMRLKRFIEDRTQMLAAISHDLRTPITRLRLRAEFVDDPDQRAKMLRDLEEMEAMISATLAFSRDDAAREPAVVLNVAGLLEMLANDARAARQDVTYTGPRHCDVLAKPLSLKRALTNLIDNAVKYGLCARIALVHSGEAVEILIDDEGPGIPERDRERVFAPFVRLEASRSRETGGVGLGLTIARNTLRGMGGDVELRSCLNGGLRVRVTLPAAAEVEEQIAAE